MVKYPGTEIFIEPGLVIMFRGRLEFVVALNRVSRGTNIRQKCL